MRGILAIGAVVLTLIAVGVYGCGRAQLDGSVVDHAYLVLQLFVLEGDWTLDHHPLPMELEFIRFAAPLTLVSSFVLVFARGAWLAFTNVQIRVFNEHIVVVGLNSLSWHLLVTAKAVRYRVVVIDNDPDNPLLEASRRLGIRVITGDAQHGAVLRAAGVLRAAHLVAFTTSDGANVEVTLRTKRLLRDEGDSGSHALRIHVHLESIQLANRLEDYPKFFEDYGVAEVNFFNTDEQSARALFLDQPFETFADALGQTGVHFAVFGFNTAAQQVIMHAARMAHYGNLTLPKISVFTDGAAAKREALRADIPGLWSAADLSFHEMQPPSYRFIDSLEVDTLNDVTAYIVCMDDDQSSLNVALALRNAVLLKLGENAPIVVQMRSSSGLAQLLESQTGAPEIPDGLFPFGMLDLVLNVQNVVNDEQDTLAKAIQENYLVSVETIKHRQHPAQRPWSQLPEQFRKRNRLHADHLAIRLRAINCRQVAKLESVELDEAEIVKLAQMEKQRWIAERYSFGWRPGPKRNDLAKIHELMIPWEDLSDQDKIYDLNDARSIPQLFRDHLAAGLSRELIVGVTGHRLHKVDPNDAHLRDACVRVLHDLRDRYRDRSFIVLSPLAEGADRLVAELAMEELDAKLHVPLPLPYEIYIQDFDPDDQQASVDHFKTLIGRAERYYELPLAGGSFNELSQRDSVGNEARAKQYALVGAYIVQRCHELIAIWDGTEPNGVGGTGQIVHWRLNGVPEAFRYANAFFPAVEQLAPFVVAPEPAKDFQPVRFDAA